MSRVSSRGVLVKRLPRQAKYSNRTRTMAPQQATHGVNRISPAYRISERDARSMRRRCFAV